VELAPAELVSKLQATLASAREQGSASEFPFRLITKREGTTHNSWTHNYEGFLRGDQGRNYVFMNPTDAAALGLKPDDLADVRSSAGAIRLPVRTSDDLLAGVVAVPHGWGHQASGQRVAAGSLGVNVNILASSGAAHVDPFSGMSHLTGLPVDVRLAADDRLAGNWSGIARPPGGPD
jgi:anaerobic selenocysteine-containing dehydrogenase